MNIFYFCFLVFEFRKEKKKDLNIVGICLRYVFYLIWKLWKLNGILIISLICDNVIGNEKIIVRVILYNFFFELYKELI